MRPSDLPLMRGVSLFKDMSYASFEKLLLPAYLQTFPAHLTLIYEGDRPDFLYVVIEGLVEIIGATDNREATLAMVEPSGTFVLSAVLKGAPYIVSARTVGRSQLLLIPVESVHTALSDDPAFSRAIFLEMATRYRRLVKDLKNLKLRSAVERLANFLLCCNSAQEGADRFELPYEKRLIASFLGIAPESLSRSFGALRAYGVEVRGSCVHLMDIKSLEAFAKSTPSIDDPEF